MIAVTFALPQESQDFVHELTHVGATYDSALPILLGNLSRHEIAICHTGVGVVSARAAVRRLFSLHRPRMLIAAGFAGGLDPRLRVADLVIATNFSNEKMLDLARGISSSRCYFGTLTTQPEIAETVEGKEQLFKQTKASVIDMETSAIAEVCREFDTAMLSVRSISDAAGDSLPVPFSVWFDAKKQKPRVLALLKFLATNPRRIAPFIRFVNGIDRARAELTDYLLELIPGL